MHRQVGVDPTRAPRAGAGGVWRSGGDHPPSCRVSSSGVLTRAPGSGYRAPGMIDPAREIDEGFVRFARALTPANGASDAASLGSGSRLDAAELVALLEAQMVSRHLDFAARALREAGRGFYTIGSSGHEGNAALAAATRPTDPALLHYRSGAFYVRRAAQVPGIDP